MLLTIILLSHKNDIQLTRIIKNFIQNSPFCELKISDSGTKRKIIEDLIKSEDNISIVYNQKSGIYDSINNALKLIRTEYYLVLGLDDKLDYKILKKFLDFLEKFDVDLFFAGVIKAGRKLLYLKTERKDILLGPAGTFPSHTGGIAIRRSLHDKYGEYSLDFKVISDLLFISTCLLEKCTFKLFKGFICDIGATGFSKTNENLAEYESMFVRNKLGASIYFSFLIYIFRLNKRILKKIILKIKNIKKYLILI